MTVFSSLDLRFFFVCLVCVKFFAVFPLLCIILNASQRTKNGAGRPGNEAKYLMGCDIIYYYAGSCVLTCALWSHVQTMQP